MVWDELTSVPEKFGDSFATEGMMGTFDEETRFLIYFFFSFLFFKYFFLKNQSCFFYRNFFKNTNVEVQPMFRIGHMGLEEAIFSHHQKTIICDDNSMVIAYIGGLDLTQGRWDSPEHTLFSTLETTHQKDFYSNCVPSATQKTGPRQPWHDIHSRVEGEIAKDLFHNFCSRWTANPKNPNSNIEDLTKFFFKEDKEVHTYLPPVELKDVTQFPVLTSGPWDCQLLRSIDKYSVDRNLASSSNDLSVARDIHNAYVHRIMTAQRFVYIENQYFMGSSHFWKNVAQAQPGLRNLIPIALTEKIISKIYAGEDFVVYVIVPMFPEGDPETMGMQVYLFLLFIFIIYFYYFRY